ncbi:DUF6185 family protein [Streptomyces sp. NPDC004658]|uniref:DUF6185 family protein n=1 Tax=Streptomyces sp. NPDC004658 TaxID=3154672 RepID=UPI0033A3F4A3
MIVVWGLSAGAGPAHAQDDVCAVGGLTGARASASVRLDDRHRTQTKIVSRLTVHLPSRWSHAAGLLLGQDSEGYRLAMRCLARGPDPQQQWWDEWRPHPPEIIPQKGGLEVRIDTYAWADDEGMTYVGPWDVEVGHDRWRVRLDPPPALRRVRWSSVVVDPGTASALKAEPRPTTGKAPSGLVWKPASGAMPAVDVSVDPAWQHSWAAQTKRLRFSVSDRVGGAFWGLSLLVMLVWATRRTQQEGIVTPEERRSIRAAVLWAGVFLLILVIGSGDNLYYEVSIRHFPTDPWEERQAHSAPLLNVLLGGMLLCYGRPRRLTVRLAGVALAVPAVVVTFWPQTFGMTGRGFLTEDAPDRAVLAVFTSTGCSLTLLLMGHVATGWRLARSAGLVPARPPKTPGGPPEPRELFLRYLAPVLGLVVALMSLWAASAYERDWQRASWLSDRSALDYGTQHLQVLRNDLVWFATNGQDWWFGQTWLLCGLVVLAVIRARAARAAVATSEPSPVDVLWLLVFFPVTVGLVLGTYAGNGSLSGFWFLLNLASLGLVLAGCAGQAVLDKPLHHSHTRLRETIDGPARAQLLDRARRFREIHSELRRLDQGQAGDSPRTRRAYERELRGLHRWRSPSGADRLPADVSVVDAALALGPHDTWWANGRLAARVAALAGLPATALIVWADMFRGDALASTLFDAFGLPNTVAGVLYWEATWAAAGFLLGALWSRLPGRRGPIRSLLLAVAYALPIAVDAIGNWIAHQGQGTLALYAVSMLLVLTVTGIVMDLETFRGERRYWQSRIGLLLSVYQMRYFSLQVAYVLAQLVAVFTLWQFFADAGGPPSPGADPQAGTGGSHG